jgi:cobyrinic acid a,c-diamide synthase
MTSAGLIIAAPSTGSGKTVVTLGLLRAFADLGLRMAVAKIGPDYIDPAFLAAAARGPCTNLDTWAMRPATINARIAALGQADLILCEGVMGLFDGADVPSGQLSGSTAEIAALTGWPVVLVIDAARQGASAAALLRGFATHSADVKVIGAILNRLAGDAHRWMIEHACAEAHPSLPPLVGWIPRDPSLALPERHLGLVQARETEQLEARIDAIARIVAAHVDFESLNRIFKPAKVANAASPGPPLPPLGQRISVARDDAFAFIYGETLNGWRNAGAEISFFSPLADEPPSGHADAVYLPGGYPELHAANLAAAANFLGGLRTRAEAGVVIFGECGGAMTLGETLEDADGVTHRMAALLPLATSFKARKLHLGYRRCELLFDSPLGRAHDKFRAHEFHYASEVRAEGRLLFDVADARGRALGPMGQISGRVMGSFMHLIDRA